MGREPKPVGSSNEQRADMERMRIASGEVCDKSPLVAFLYLLMRDELASGVVERVADKAAPTPGVSASSYTNGWLAQHARDIAARLTVGPF